jgi:hypothetical protein
MIHIGVGAGALAGVVIRTILDIFHRTIITTTIHLTMAVVTVVTTIDQALLCVLTHLVQGVDLLISQVEAARAHHTEAVVVAERSTAVELLQAAEAIVVMQAVLAVAARSIAEIATAQPVVAHLTSATTITRSVAHQAMAVTREVTLAADSRQGVATVVVRADDSLV